MTLLTRRREITAHPAEVPRAIFGPEAARDFLPHLQHAQVALRAVVGEGHREVTHEAQHLVAAAQESVDEPPLRRERRALFLRRRVTSAISVFCRVRVELVGSLDQAVVAAQVGARGLFAELALTRGARLSCGLFDLDEQRRERLGPDRLRRADLCEVDEVTQQVSIAEAM